MRMFEVGKTYTSRCFNDHNLIESFEVVKRTEKTITVKSIYNDIIRCVEIGIRPREIAKQIKDDFGVSAYQAARLVNTELAKVVSDAQLDVYRNSGVVEKVMWMATLENNTCETCADYDGKEFLLNDAPKIPVHPNCRCCYVPIVDGYKPGKRADNETHKNIDYKTFNEWKGSK